MDFVDELFGYSNCNLKIFLYRCRIQGREYLLPVGVVLKVCDLCLCICAVAVVFFFFLIIYIARLLNKKKKKCCGNFHFASTQAWKTDIIQ